MKPVKLKELFEAKAFYNHCLYDLDVNQRNCIIDIMQDACKEIIDLCAENATLNGYVYSHGIEKEIVDLGQEICIDEEQRSYVGINKLSILDTQNQIDCAPFLK